MDRGSLVGCSPWGHKESDTTEQLHFHFSLSCIGEGNGSPLQCSCLENPRDWGAWWAAVYGVAQSRTRLKRRSSSSNHVGCRLRNELHSSSSFYRKGSEVHRGEIMSKFTRYAEVQPNSSDSKAQHSSHYAPMLLWQYAISPTISSLTPH